MGETTTALEWRLAQISHSDLVDMSAAAHSPEAPPWSRAGTGTEAWSPRPCCSLLGHRRPAVTRSVDVYFGGVSWRVDAICFEAPHACPPCCPLTDVSRDRAAEGKAGAWWRERQATATPSGRQAKCAALRSNHLCTKKRENVSMHN